jgi:hypothetical protein
MIVITNVQVSTLDGEYQINIPYYNKRPVILSHMLQQISPTHCTNEGLDFILLHLLDAFGLE